ncbi:beta-ketoacyl-[acyl-carrier-protein] synthase family protein [Arachidicoccus ginsenosidivorans]|jgi:3-oxoacyl-(acyl-carrier-protein) synthase|uniref:3-oxoacyl-[acyl-carrier-protein] synthase 1 n=1 Tax=Arachidicoccus ginsenosidivorans TaxID=496057 RepID=A0A5B8VM03_9BACT|nr:beta-ketoacyl-[acyl-carrier-protein] synthase family protein [Arachidicoccus ginsenosidivorans]QEC71268.1 beta-ketoacyl-[acyl-carrier-protein] synthase family protein [Arachidicoccus ginsenosidivorans]
MEQRVVITGLGVVSPNGVGVEKFTKAIKNGQSGIKFHPELNKLSFRCQIGGVPAISENARQRFLKKHGIEEVFSTGITYGCIAASEAWRDSGLKVRKASESPDYESGCIFGTGSNGIEATHYGIALRESGQDTRKGNPRALPQAINSAVSAFIAKIIGLGGQVTSNASACNTGTEAILMAFDKIKNKQAVRMLVGSSESNSPYVWGPFDSMFATAHGFNDQPKKASRPMDKDASGFVPSSGAGALVIESLSAAKKRGAKIYAEVLGGHINSGGQRGKGTMTIGNVNGMVRCIKNGLKSCQITPDQIDLISGHLSSTIGDITEINAWVSALKRKGTDFPYINSMKSMIGHCLSASGSIESVAAVLQLYNGFIHPSINADQLHPEIASLISHTRVPPTAILDAPLNIVCKISFGFGDVNSCLLLKKYID